MSDTLPIDRVTFVTTDDAANFSIDGSGNFTWTPAVPSLAPSGTLTVLLTVQVNNSLASGITDVTIPISVTHANIEPTPANNSAADTDSLDAAPDLRLTKTDFTGTITWNVGNLAAGESRSFTVTAKVRDTIPASFDDFTHSTTITDDASNGADLTPADNAATDNDTLDAEPDYAITIDGGETLVRLGDPLNYTINVANNGNQDGYGVVVTVSFPVTVLKNVVASNGGVVDAIAGTITWNLGDLAAGDATTLTVSTQVRSNISTQTPSITLVATVIDDGLNGTDPTPLNNAGSDLDRVQVYAYDSFHDWKGMRVAWLMPQTQTVGRPLAPLPVDPVFSGATEPGSTLVARIYDADGRLLGDRQVVADSAGNWLVSFPNIIIYEYPHRIEIIVTPAINNLAHEYGFNLRRYFHPAIHAGLVMTEPLSIASVFRNRAYNIVEAQHSADTHPLGFQWYSHAYELNAASSNVSQM